MLLQNLQLEPLQRWWSWNRLLQWVLLTGILEKRRSGCPEVSLKQVHTAESHMTMPGAGGSPANLGEISGETKTSGFFYLQNCKKIGYVVLITCSVNFFFLMEFPHRQILSAPSVPREVSPVFAWKSPRSEHMPCVLPISVSYSTMFCIIHGELFPHL